MWNRIIGLKRLGFMIQLIYWAESKKTVADTQRIASTVDSTIQLTRSKNPSRFLNLRYPPRALSYTCSREEMTNVLSKVIAFDPQWVLLDGWNGYLLAKELAEKIRRPLVYRSHNVEYKLYEDLLSVTRNLQWLKTWLNAFHLQSLETEIRERSNLVLDISDEDRSHWLNLNSKVSQLLLPTWIPPAIGISNESEILQQFDMLYGGNLWAPHNIDGLNWFCRYVLPIVKANGQNNLRIAFVGSNPREDVRRLCRTYNIQCIENPKELVLHYLASRVLINPLLRGSGMNLKMIEMLWTGKPIVATRIAIRGLPEPLRKAIYVSDNEIEFAENILTALSVIGPSNRVEIMHAINQHFGEKNLQQLASWLRELSGMAGEIKR